MTTPTSNLKLRSINSPQALEGGDLLFDIAFVAAANVPTNLNLNFAGIAEKGVDYQASFQASFDGGRSFQTFTGTDLSVPVGCTGVLVRVLSIEDQSFEKSERVTITATVNQDTLTGSGLIVNDDRPAITVVSVTGDEKVEGNNLVFTVQLDGNIPNTQFPPGSLCPHPAWTCTQENGKGTIDLGGYSITLDEERSVWVLTNKATCTTTKIWGDPHVDIGNNGSNDFDFKKTMSLQLSDGTKITVDTVDWGNSGQTLSSKLTITDWCGNKAMVVTGLGWDSDGVGNLDVQKIDGQGKALDLATSDGAFTLYENPNGDWNIFNGQVASQSLIDKLESGELVDSGSTVNLSVAAGTAVLSQDFLAPIEVSMDNGVTWSLASAGSVRVPTGIDSFLARVATVNDEIAEITENLTLSAKSGTSIASALGNILDNDAIPSTVTCVSSVTANEGEPLQFEVVLSGASTVSTNLTLNLANGTATGGVDFATTDLQVSFNNGLTWTTLSSNVVCVPACASSLLVKVAGIDDQVYEGTSEAFTLSATANGGAASGIGTICENDSAPKVLSITDASANEGDALNFTVRLTGASATETPVSLAAANGTADGSDFSDKLQVSFDGGANFSNVVGTNVNVPAGVTSFEVRIASTEDTNVEADETFTLQASANGGSATGNAVILNDDSPPLPIQATVTCVSSVTANEGDPLQFEVVLSEASTVSTNVTLTLADGSANGGLDFATTGVQVSFNGGQNWVTITSTTVSVPAGSTSLLVKVGGIDDTIFEDAAEVFTLSAEANGGSAFGIGTICENDSAPKVLSISNASASEGDALNFHVELSGTSATVTTVNLALANGSAEASDYSAALEVSFDGATYVSVVGASVSVPAGVASFEIRVASTEDVLVEGDETFTLQASANGGSALATGTILNDDAPPPPPVQATVTCVSSVTANEGEALQFEVVLSEASTVATNVTLNLVNGTATGGLDFATTGVQVSFNDGQTWATLTSNNVGVPPGSRSMLVKVAGIEDTVYEGASETFTLSASANGSTESGIGTICENDDAPKVLSITNAYALEGDNLQFNVQLTGSATSETTVSLATTNGTTDASDFSDKFQASFDGGSTFLNVVGTSVNVPTGVTSFMVRIATTEDTLVETDESFTLQASANGGSATATATIANDDNVVLPPPPPPPPVQATVSSVSSVTANEGEALQFEVALSEVSTVSTEITLNLSNGTATSGLDFSSSGVQVSFNGGQTWTTLTSNTVNVPPGSSALLVKVAGLDDNVYEGSSEAFSLTASANGGSATGIGTICENDDAPKVLSISNASASEGDSLNFHVALTNAATSETTVNLAVSNGTANGSDFSNQLQASFDGGITFVNLPGTNVNVPAGVTSFEVRIASTEDVTVEADETFTLQASANGGSATATATILNDDVAAPPPPPPVIEAKVLGVSCASANEGDPLEFNVTLDGAPTATNVTLNLVSGSATANVDFATSGVQASFDDGKTWSTLTTNKVLVPAGSTSLLVKVQSIEDNVYEGAAETFSLTASTKLSSASGVGSILNDEEPILGISSVHGGGAIEGSFLEFDIGLHGTVAYPSVTPGSTCPPENWSFSQTGSSATIDLGNYSIQLQEKLASWTLLNKETGQCTRIWGDPHVDIDNDGQIDFDFKENMSFQLTDGTKITVDTVEWERSGQTLSSKLTITDWAGQNAMVVTGLGWYSDGVANLKVEEFEGQGQALDLGTNDGSMTLYENAAGGWKIFDGRAATQVLVDQLENGLLVDPGSTITLALSQGSASLGADYLDKLEVSMDAGKTWIATDAGTVRIPVGVDHLIARVPTVDDTTGEPLEHVRLTATASTTTVSADGAIFDNDASVSSYSVSLTDAPHVDTWVTVHVGGITEQGATLFNSDGQSVDGNDVKVLVHAGETESQPFLVQNPANAAGGTHLPLTLTITGLEAFSAPANFDAPTLRDILIDTGDGEIDLAALGVQADPRLTATVVAAAESKLGAADVHGGAIDIEHLLHKPAATSEG
jgi:Domain of Unknown Function (DUF1521)/Calx-beta domain